MVASCWLVVLMSMMLLAVDLPLPVRLGLCVCGATLCVPVVRSAFLLMGPKAVRSLRWSREGIWARFGSDPLEKSVELTPGSFRIGQWLLVLRLETCDRTSFVLIDAGRQEIRGFRRLCRYLESRRRGFPEEA